MWRRFLIIVCTLSSPWLFAVTETAIFAGGRFWCLEDDFDKVSGVLETVVGFDGGSSSNPTYSLVSQGLTDYTEAVRVVYNPARVSYKELVDYFWHHIDPLAKNAQFCDQGQQYRSAIFYLNAYQKKIALASKQRYSKQFSFITTAILPSTQFYAAEGIQQNYAKTNRMRYKYYRYRCGRDERLHELWK